MTKKANSPLEQSLFDTIEEKTPDYIKKRNLLDMKNNKEFELLGPSLPYIFKENEKIRMKILIKSKNRNLIIETLNNVNKEFNKEAKERKCIVQFDIDTYQLL